LSSTNSHPDGAPRRALVAIWFKLQLVATFVPQFLGEGVIALRMPTLVLKLAVVYRALVPVLLAYLNRLPAPDAFMLLASGRLRHAE